MSRFLKKIRFTYLLPLGQRLWLNQQSLAKIQLTYLVVDSLGESTKVKNTIFQSGGRMTLKTVTIILFLTVFMNCLGHFESTSFGQQGGVRNDSVPAFAITESKIRVPSAVVKIADAISVPAEYNGVLTHMLVKEGQILKEGDLVAKIKDSELRLQLVRAEYENQIANLTAKNDVDIRFSRKSSDVAQSDVTRSLESNTRVPNAVPVAKLERQVLERDRTLLQLEQAERDFEVAKLKKNLTKNQVELSNLLLQKTEIRAPISGMVTAVERQRGEWVEPSETVIRLVKIDRLRVEGFITAESASKVRIGAPVEVKFTQQWLKDFKYQGTIVFVDPEANPINSQIVVWAEINNVNNRLVPGLRGDILIDTRPQAVQNEVNQR